MRIKTYQKMIYALFMTFLLVGVFIACSNASDEDPNNENQQIEENNDLTNEDEVNDVNNENNEESNDHNSNDNELEITDDQEQEGHVEHEPDEQLNEPDEQNVEHDSSDANNTPDNSTNATNDNTSIDSNTTAPLPPEPSDQQTEEPANNPDANVSDERPTLRSPVQSDDDPRTLTIGMYYMGSSSRNEAGFRQNYTRELEWQHPNVEIEFSSVVDEPQLGDGFSIDVTAELRKLMTGDNSPDVLFLSYNDYLSLMEEDLFVELNPFFVDSELSLDDFEPIVTDGLINPQDGQTYGLSPYFSANALIYNKDLFDEMNVPYPRDHMTWEEVFTLAKQMTIRSEERDVYGFAFDLNNHHRVPLLFDVWRSYAHGLEVQFYDRETEKPLVNNDEWAKIFTSVKDLYDAGVFPTESEGAEIYRSNPFYLNTIAMAVVPYGELRQIIDATLSGQQSVPNWDVVTIPVDPNRPQIGAGVIMEPVLAINANGKNQLDAWRLIESIHSEEWARMSEERLIYNLSSRKDHAVNLADVEYNKAAFYQFKPAKYPPRRNSHTGIIDPYFDFISAGESALSKFITGEIDIHEALEEFEYRVNYHLERSKEIE